MKLFLRYTIFLTLCFYLIFAGLVQATIVIEGDTVRVDTANYIVHFEKGEINHIHNKLTAKTYTIFPEASKRGWTGLMFTRYFWDSSPTRSATLVSTSQVSPNRVELVYGQDGTEIRLNIMIDTVTDDMLIDMEGVSDSGGVVGVQWGIGYLDIANLKVIVPVSGGRVYDHTDKFQSDTYPGSGRGWEAQLAIVQGDAGGFYVRNTDTMLEYKQVIFDPLRGGGGAALNFATQNQAPFDSHTSGQTRLWRFNTYVGDWRVPALIYRDWMAEAFEVTPLSEKNDWVEDITLFVKTGLSGDFTGYNYLEDFTVMIDRLAQLVDPDKTMVYLGGWKIGGSDWWVHEEDIAHPDFIPKEALAEFLAVTRKHGFRTILYITAHGCSPNHPLYESVFKQYQYRDTWTGELVGENLEGPTVHPIHPLMNISPASSEFRSYVLTQLKAVWDEYDIDGFFIDASHSVMNNATGLIEGLSTAQGMALLHQEMIDMMPGAVLGGERLHEATFVHESFAQRPLFGDKPRRHPISSFLFSPFVHAVDLAPHWYEDTPEHYQRVLLHGDVYDIMPTINVFKAHQLEDDDPEIGIIAMADHWQGGGGLQPDVNGDGQVNVFDLVIIVQNFGAQPLMNLKVDVNGDGRVNMLDLIVVSNWIEEPTVPR